MAERKQITNDKELYAFMMAYQDYYGIAPTLNELVTVHARLNHRSSAFYAVRRLMDAGLVVVTKESDHKRRYKAI
jgi:predicted transcriptional regulator